MEASLNNEAVAHKQSVGCKIMRLGERHKRDVRSPVMSHVTLAFVAPWECSRAVANIPREPRDDVIVVLLESVAKGASLPWHRQKLVLVLSAMRHFADALQAAGYRVAVRRSATYADGLRDAAQEFGATRVVATEGREQDMVDELTCAAARGISIPKIGSHGPKDEWFRLSGASNPTSKRARRWIGFRVGVEDGAA